MKYNNVRCSFVVPKKKKLFQTDLQLMKFERIQIVKIMYMTWGTFIDDVNYNVTIHVVSIRNM